MFTIRYNGIICSVRYKAKMPQGRLYSQMLHSQVVRITLLAPRDVGKRLKLSTSRVIQLDREGVLRAIRDSAGRRFYDSETVEHFAAERERRAGANRDKSTAEA